MMFDLIFSKLGAVLAALAGGLFLWLRGNWHKARAERAEAEKEAAKAEVEVTKTQLEVEREVRKVEEKIDNLSPDELIDEFRLGGLRDSYKN